MTPRPKEGSHFDSIWKCRGSFLCLSADHERACFTIAQVIFPALERAAGIVSRHRTRIEDSLVANVLETGIDEKRSIVINAEQLYGNLQSINPLVRRLVLPIQIDDCDEQTAGLQHAMNFLQRL